MKTPEMILAEAHHALEGGDVGHNPDKVDLVEGRIHAAIDHPPGKEHAEAFRAAVAFMCSRAGVDSKKFRSWLKYAKPSEILAAMLPSKPVIMAVAEKKPQPFPGARPRKDSVTQEKAATVRTDRTPKPMFSTDMTAERMARLVSNTLGNESKWTQGSVARDADGRALMDVFDDGACKFCASGHAIILFGEEAAERLDAAYHARFGEWMPNTNDEQGREAVMKNLKILAETQP